ncbi:MAG: alkene reductase [Fimbriimonadaceae bacterium]|nr:alkene reductase [Fimbriimonadaceae bacterium]QYK55319.1 MAG: alkene reductase [Fimbriimonadaceae bacterium]
MLDSLLSPYRLGTVTLPNRIVMAPLTRSRAGAERIPNEMIAEYYRQRSGAGLIVSEATSISPSGVGYEGTPGIWTVQQEAAWKHVTNAVHHASGRIFCQLWHVGRISHRMWQNANARPVAPSAVKPEGQIRTPNGMEDFDTPRALETAEIPSIVDDYRRAAEAADRAGFDGVEIHGANGYLVEQFLRDGTNLRTDRYGGSIENRARFCMEVLDAILEYLPAENVGLRLSPHNLGRGMTHSDLVETYRYVAEQAQERKIAYLHVVGALDSPEDQATPAIRQAFRGPLIVCGGYTLERALKALDLGADLVAFGRPFISNPDLPERFRRGAPLAEWNTETFYTPGPTGYIDYPALDVVASGTA